MATVHLSIEIGPYLTFNLQKNMVLLDPQVVGGNTGVFSTVYWLGHIYLQCTILVNHIWVTIPYADLTVFEPAQVV